MIASTDETEPFIDNDLAIRPDEYAAWTNEINQVQIHYSIFELIHALKDRIQLFNQRIQNDGSSQTVLYVSDRRWKKLIKLLRTSAFLNGRDTICLSDCLMIRHCIWNEVEQMEEVNEMVKESIRQSMESYLLDIKDLNDNLRELRDNLSSENTVRENFDPGIQLIDNYYYQIEGVRMRERLLIFASDYQRLDDTGKLYFLQKEKYKANCCILKKYDPLLHSKANPKQIYTLKRGVRSVVINGFEYKLLCHERCAPPPPMPAEEDMEIKFQRMDEVIGRAESSWGSLWKAEIETLESHLFLSNDEKQSLKRMFDAQKHNILRYRNELNELKDAYRKEKQEYQVERPENDLFS
jgi:MoxR-like ATPase